MRRGDFVLETSVLLGLEFPAAADAWLEEYAKHIKPKTFREYKNSIKRLSKFFGPFRLEEIDLDLARGYQTMRKEECRHIDPLYGGHCAINHELLLLNQIRKRAGLEPIAYTPLPIDEEIRGQALTEEAEVRLLRMARTNKDWYACYLFAGLSVNTSCGPKELLTQRLSDINLKTHRIHVCSAGAKRKSRIRDVKLNEAAYPIMLAALERARQLGSTEPDHFLFPKKVGGKKYDPCQHQVSFKHAWGKLRVAAGLPKLRMYDLRHTVVTRLAENPNVSEKTIEAVVGHVDPRIKDKYIHISRKLQDQAVDELMLTKKRPPEKVRSGTSAGTGTSDDRTDEFIDLLMERMINRMKEKSK